MIYLIGGSPKCGKTTLTKKLFKELGIPWISTDTLEVIGMNYTKRFAKEKFDSLYPHSSQKGNSNDETYAKYSPAQIAKNYQKQSKATYEAIYMFCACSIIDGIDYVVEGYHITPELVARLVKKYGKKNFKTIFLLKENTKKFLEDLKKSSTPNDWILRKTKKEETFLKIAEMIRIYSQWFKQEAKKYKFKSVNMDKHFFENVDRIVQDFT